MTPQVTVELLGLAIAWAFAAGALLLLALTGLPATRPAARQLWPILASEIAILALGILPWLLPSTWLLVILLLASARIGFESGSVNGLSAGREFRFSHMMLLIVASGAGWWLGTPVVVLGGAILCLAALIVTGLRTGTSLTGNLARFTIFPLLPIAAFSHAAGNAALAPVLVLAFFLVEMFDSFSLLGGRLFGRRPLVPRLSPRKTGEGLVTGTFAVFIAVIGLVIWLDLPLALMLVTGFVVIIAAFVGDLLGSAAKRKAGVKDYPAVMKVQGGLLDIMDSWLLAGSCLAGLYALWGAG